MCRGVRSCPELANRERWSRRAPLVPPTIVREHIDRLATILRSLGDTSYADAKVQLAELGNDALRAWGVEHGQMSGIHRHQALGKPPALAAEPATGPRKPNRSLGIAVFERDNYHCRYCTIPVIPREVLLAISHAVGPAVFPVGRANNSTHGLALLAWAQLDHVVPFQQGGATTLENVVTACWACNYGKDRFTVAQLGMDDPRDYLVIASDWDGLVSLLPSLA